MELTIKIENKKMYHSLIHILKSLGIKIISTSDLSMNNKQDKLHASKTISNANFASKEEFWSMFGIGKQHPLSVDEIRKRAWKSR